MTIGNMIKKELAVYHRVPGSSDQNTDLDITLAILYGVPDFTAPYRRWLEGMRMLEGIDARTEMDQRQLRDLLNTWVTCGK